MKRNILGVPYEAHQKKYKKRVRCLAALGVLCTAINFVLFFCATEQTRLPFTVVNIFCDIAVFSFIYGYGMLVLRQMRRKGRLYRQKEHAGEVLRGEVGQVRGFERVEDFDCRRVIVKNEKGQRSVFVPDRELLQRFVPGKHVAVLLVNHIVVEAGDDEEF